MELALTINQPAVLASVRNQFNAVDYDDRQPEGTKNMRNCIRSFAPVGSTISVVNRLMPDGTRNLRLYTSNRGRVTRIDHLLTLTLFSEVLANIGFPADADRLVYCGFDKTDGTRMSGFILPSDPTSNMTIGIVYALAKVVHGDRQSWKVAWL